MSILLAPGKPGNADNEGGLDAPRGEWVGAVTPARECKVGGLGGMCLAGGMESCVWALANAPPPPPLAAGGKAWRRGLWWGSWGECPPGITGVRLKATRDGCRTGAAVAVVVVVVVVGGAWCRSGCGCTDA